jgi:enoyl-CoA hydratase/carnithine racemase
MDFETLQYEKSGRIARITLNRPEALNAVNPAMARDLDEVFEVFDHDDDVWLAILSGNGRCFCAGADVKVFASNLEAGSNKFDMFHSRKDGGFMRSQNYKPVIAAVHGYCYGSGLGLAMGSDILLVAADARFQITELQRGIGGGHLGVRMNQLGLGRVGTEIALTGRALTGEEAYRLGFANQLVASREELMATAEGFAQEILQHPPLAVRANVRASRNANALIMGMLQPAMTGPDLSKTADYAEATRAFVEKRKPTFHAR